MNRPLRVINNHGNFAGRERNLAGGNPTGSGAKVSWQTRKISVYRARLASRPVRAGLAILVLLGAVWIEGIVVGLLVGVCGLSLGGLMGARPADTAVPASNRARFDQELERARRLGHCLVLLRIPGAGAVAHARLAHPTQSLVTTRRLDLLWMEGSDVFLTLYNTRDAGVDIVLGRIADLGIDVSGARYAIFPDSALTAGAMWRDVGETWTRGLRRGA